jgi:hypothetical protein
MLKAGKSEMKKVEINGKKYVQVGPLRIPYETSRETVGKRIRIGPFSLHYLKDDRYNRYYLRMARKLLSFRRKDSVSVQVWHFRIRDELSDKRIEEILTEELTANLGYKPDLSDPQTFNEKLAWIKIHEKDPLITVCCDKHAVKKYVSEKVGEDFIIPVLAEWKDPEQVDLNRLPDAFALKVNWSSGYNIIVKDKSKLDEMMMKKQLEIWMRPENNSYYDSFNWGYKNMDPVIYAEPYLEQIDGQIYDYKFYFNKGEYVFMFIATDRFNGLTYTFYDRDFQFLPLRYGHKPNAVPHPAMPKNLGKMLEIGKKLAEPFPFVRVDFYETGDKIYVGEMTFYSGGGKLPFDPLEWDRRLGEEITAISAHIKQ